MDALYFDMNEDDICKKSKDGLHRWKTIFGDDVGKDQKCIKCGIVEWVASY